jgi:lysophospholipase L1-like esterase
VLRPRLLLGGLLAVLALIGTAVAVTVAGAQSPTPLGLALQSDDGRIGATVTGPDGVVVSLVERVGDQDVALSAVTLVDGRAEVATLTPWTCDAQLRRFEARTDTEVARAAVRTPSCARRLEVGDVERRVEPGDKVRVRLVDSWGQGEKARACLDVPHAAPRCRTVRVPASSKGRTLRYRLTTAGRSTIAVTGEGGRTVHRRVDVRPPAHLRLLATGDSMIQIIDSYLKARLPSATVRSGAHISTGISKPFMLDWVALAKRQAASFRPDATVMFIGANDGFPIGSAGCCGSDWIDAYAKRAETMMRAYLRDGAGRVYWLLLPPSGKPQFQRVFVAVNAALRQAAKSVGKGIELLDDGAIVAPGGHFSMTLNGKVVRQDDKVHLSTYGASIVANEIISALRKDGLVS